jgi:malate dehydrogenase (oxaloacetate-decarboxylating)
VGDALSADHVIPSPFDRSVVPVVAEAVAATARDEGHVRPGSRGSLTSESDAAMHEAARRAVQRARERGAGTG